MQKYTDQHWFFTCLVPSHYLNQCWFILKNFRVLCNAWSAPSHYLNQWWNIVNWTLGNKLQWNFNRNSYIFIQKNLFETVVWKMAAILFWPQCVKELVQECCLRWTDRPNKQRVLMHRHQGWNVRHGLCHIYMRYIYIYELFIAFVCFVVCSLL